MESKKTEYISFRTDKKTKEMLEKQAQNERRTLSQIIQFAVEEYIKRKE